MIKRPTLIQDLIASGPRPASRSCRRVTYPLCLPATRPTDWSIGRKGGAEPARIPGLGPICTHTWKAPARRPVRPGFAQLSCSQLDEVVQRTRVGERLATGGLLNRRAHQDPF